MIGQNVPRVAVRVVLGRAGYACEACGKQANHRDVFGLEMGLEIHHRNSDRKDNRPGNLMVLCDPCHSLQHTGPQFRRPVGPPLNGLLTSVEVAARLRVSPERVRQLVRAGTLAPVKRGQTNFFRRADVDALVRVWEAGGTGTRGPKPRIATPKQEPTE